MSNSAIFLLTLSISILRSSSSPAAAAAEEESMMQKLWRAELVRVAGYGEERLSSVLVTGSLLYQDKHFSSGSNNHLITTSYAKGVKVVVACKTDEGMMRRRRFVYGRTDGFGDFIINIPSHLHAIPNFQDSCFVRILGKQKKSPHFHQISVSNPIRIKLSYAGNDSRVYTAGTVRTSLRS